MENNKHLRLTKYLENCDNTYLGSFDLDIMLKLFPESTHAIITELHRNHQWATIGEEIRNNGLINELAEISIEAEKHSV